LLFLLLLLLSLMLLLLLGSLSENGTICIPRTTTSPKIFDIAHFCVAIAVIEYVLCMATLSQGFL